MTEDAGAQNRSFVLHRQRFQILNVYLTEKGTWVESNNKVIFNIHNAQVGNTDLYKTGIFGQFISLLFT